MFSDWFVVCVSFVICCFTIQKNYLYIYITLPIAQVILQVKWNQTFCRSLLQQGIPGVHGICVTFRWKSWILHTEAPKVKPETIDHLGLHAAAYTTLAIIMFVRICAVQSVRYRCKYSYQALQSTMINAVSSLYIAACHHIHMPASSCLLSQSACSGWRAARS